MCGLNSTKVTSVSKGNHEEFRYTSISSLVHSHSLAGKTTIPIAMNNSDEAFCIEFCHAHCSIHADDSGAV